MLKFKTENTIIYLLVLYLAGLISRFTPLRVMTISLSAFFYCFAVVVWMIAIRERFISKDIRNLFYSIAVLILILHLSQICKYSAFGSDIFVQRHLWYAYYIPFTMIPLLSLIVSIKIGKSSDARMHWSVIIASVFSILLILTIMTNDLHQAVFKFRDGNLDNINDYHRSIIYYIDLAWGYILMAASCTISIHKSYKRIRKRYILLILIVFIAHILLQGILYTNIAGNLKVFGTVPFTVPMLYNMSFVLFWELGIRYGIIPSNTDYEEIFNIAGIAAQLTDTDGKTVFKSNEARNIPENIKQSTNEVFAVNDGDRKIHSRGITGGFIYWEEDVSRINSLNRELMETTDRLKEENTLLFEETRIKEENARISAVSRIYDDITERLKDRLRKIDEILGKSDITDEEGFRKDLIYACIIGAYVKRYSNMTLLSKTQGENSQGNIASKELYLAFKESLEYLSLCDGMTCEAFYNEADGDHEVTNADMALAIYEAVEECIEILAFRRCTVMFSLAVCDLNLIKVDVEVDITQGHTGDDPSEQITEWVKQYAERLGSCDITIRNDNEADENDTVYITITNRSAGAEVPNV